MKQNILRVAVAISLVLFVAIVALWVRSQLTFTRIGYRYSTGTSAQFKQRRVTFLTWRNATEVMVSTEVFHPDDEAARIRLRRDLPRAPRIELYQQSGLSMDESDAADHWGFWYRSPEDSRRLWLQYSAMKPVGDSEYALTTESERAFFLPWWFLTVVFGIMPCVLAARRIRRSLRVWADRCPKCGYDLRFTPTQCPECGWKSGER